MLIGTCASFFPTAVPRRLPPTLVVAPALSEPCPAPVRQLDTALAQERLSAMGLVAQAAAKTTQPKLNPFIGFRSKMAKLRDSGVVSVPRVL